MINQFKIYRAAICLLSLGSATVTFAQTAQIQPNVLTAMETVKAEQLKAHIEYLADDKLRGRAAGTPGYQMAVDYVVNQYQSLGLTPAGEKGYLQTVRLRRAFPGKEGYALLTLDGKTDTLHFGKTISVNPNFEEASVSVSAPLVFAGYGISAPALGYDDYAGLNVKGKIVVVVRGTPKLMEGNIASYNTDMQTVLRTAMQKGAKGVIIGLTGGRGNVPNLQRGVLNVMNANGTASSSRNFVGKGIRLYATINPTTLNAILKSNAIDTAETFKGLKQGKPASKQLDAKLSTSYTTRYEDMESYNVVGKIEGSDPKLKNEYVVHTAHLDHVGIGAPVKGDSLYNGAHDNASGVGSLLEIARIYKQIEKPKRSILITMVTGEELGLLGSSYFAKNPTVRKTAIVANINTDMPTIIAPLLSVVPLGADHSSLMGPVQQAATQLGLTVEKDPEPEQNRFVRSDQYSFVAQGIPALHIKYGNKTADGKNNLSEFVQKWRAEYYHKPQDDINGIFDFEAGRSYVKLNFLIGYLVAQDVARPTWNKDDFFAVKH